MLLMIDNYDSFTYNLVQELGELMARDASVEEEIRVVRNDRASVAELDEIGPDRIIISPGPCTPNEAGISCQVITHFAGKVPIFGVCLGHQCMAHAYGGVVERHRRLMHGKTSMIEHDGKSIFNGLKNPFEATRYHSLSVREDALPDCFEVSARAEPDEIMAIRHKDVTMEGVQFHPESFLTGEGMKLLDNFLRL
jgi:anthranilate synthase/aminodeoxychorismate synthase-like glutamine amidotransferase